MLFTWDTTNLCIIFRSWRITGFGTLVLSLLAVMALTAGYEAVREASRRYEMKQQKVLEEMPSKSPRTSRSRKSGRGTWAHVLFWGRWHHRTQLTARIRKLGAGERKGGEGGESCFLRCAGFLFVLHHVSLATSSSHRYSRCVMVWGC